MKLFHSTGAQAADAICRNGFIDGNFMGIASGVFFADRPLDHGDGVASLADACIEVTAPDGFALDAFEVINEDKPEEAYREWLIPADIVNGWQRTQLEGDGPWCGGRVPPTWIVKD